jgi:hypothetical protein
MGKSASDILSGVLPEVFDRFKEAARKKFSAARVPNWASS